MTKFDENSIIKNSQNSVKKIISRLHKLQKICADYEIEEKELIDILADLGYIFSPKINVELA